MIRPPLSVFIGVYLWFSDGIVPAQQFKDVWVLCVLCGCSITISRLNRTHVACSVEA